MNPTLERIKKLLALSKSSNPHEADLAMAKAREIAIDAGIDLAMAAINMEQAPVKEAFTQGFVSQGKRKNVTQRAVTTILQHHFNVNILYSGSRSEGQSIIFIGRNSDVELAVYINGFLNEEFMRRWHRYREQSFQITTEERSAFIYGMQQGLSAKLDERKKQTEQNRFNLLDSTLADKVKNQYQLMVINEDEARSKAVAHYYPEVRKNYSSFKMSGSMDSTMAGFREGKSININNPLHGTESQLALG